MSDHDDDDDDDDDSNNKTFKILFILFLSSLFRLTQGCSMQPLGIIFQPIGKTILMLPLGC